MRVNDLNLYMDEALLQSAMNAPDTEPIASALAFLKAAPEEIIRQRPTPTRKDRTATTPVLKRQLTAHEQMLADAFSFRIWGDAEAGARAVDTLFQTRWGLHDISSVAQAARQWLSAVHTAGLLQEQANFARDADAWYAAAAEQFQGLMQHSTDAILDQVWLHTASLAMGVKVADVAQQQSALHGLCAIIDQIHPEGYIKAVVAAEDAQLNFAQMLAAVGALVLAAEIAEQVGGGLWAYDNRGVGIGTAVAYVVSFYFYSDKWRWGGPVDQEFVTHELVHHGAFLEIAARRSPLRATDILLTDLRPMFSLEYGGLTTLTHGVPPLPEPRKRRFLW